MTEQPTTFLLTGLPTSFLAQKLLAQLLAMQPTALVRCLIADAMLERAEQIIQRLPLADQLRVEVVKGDVSSMDFGMAGKRFVELAEQIDVIHHCVCANYGGVGREAERRVYVNSTGEVLELALAGKGRLKRLVHWGSALLSQPNNGWVSETEWNKPPVFRSRSDEMRFRAEVLIRDAMNRVPITVLRPTIIVGDSKTSEIDRMEGPYALFQALLSAPPELRMPVPGRGDQPCPFVPLDYVLEAGLAIAEDGRSAGRTFHLTDERPLSVARVFELIAEASDKPAVPPSLGRNIAALLLNAPAFDRINQVPRPFLDMLASNVSYDARNARELLAGSGIECPSVSTYLKSLLARVKREADTQAKQRRTRRHPHFEEMKDPLDS